MYKVYMHTLPDGKIYIGQSKDVYSRWKDGESYSYNEPFYDAIQEFGWDNVKHEILCTCENREEALRMEALFIFMLDSENEEVGYNRTNIKERVVSSFANRVVENDPEKIGRQQKQLYEGGIFDGIGLPKAACESIIDAWIFNDKHKKIYTLRQLHGLSYKELSKETGISIRQLKSIVYHCDAIIAHHI